MPQFQPDAYRENEELFGLLKRIADEKGATPAQISLAWMLCKKPYIVPIPGSRKEARLRENAGAAEVLLTPEEVSGLDGALSHIGMSAVFGGHPVISDRRHVMNQLTEKELFETVLVPRAVARLIIPTIISQIVTVIYNLADTFFIGQIGDPAMVAAPRSCLRGSTSLRRFPISSASAASA